MKIKFKRYLSLFCVVLMIISTLVDGLSTTVQATINSSQNLTNNSDNIEVYSTSNITVYNDKSNNGWYYFTEDGVKKTVYCYQNDRTQPSTSGTSGYTKVDYFSSTVDSPQSPATKEMIATVLYLGFPSNITGLKEHWGIDDVEANYDTQQTIWDLTKGSLVDHFKDYSYDLDLHYYAENASSPYLGKYGDSGSVSFSGNTTFQKSESTYKTEIITIDGNYTGSFSFNSLPEGIKIYDANTDTEIVGNLTTGMKIYFVYTGNTLDGSEVNLSYKYQTTEIYYLIANNKSNQDLVGLDTKDNEGNLTLTLPKDETQISYTVIKKWNDSNNSDKVRPESIQVQLKADNKNYGQPITLNETNNWTYTWDNLPEKSSGNTIQYSIEELGDLSNYNVVYENKLQETIITNNLTIDIPVVKTWVGDKKESVVVRLLADGAEVNSVELTEKTNWQHTFSDLPKYNQNTGEEINYSIKEDAVDGYNSVITGNLESGFTVTNTKISGKLEITKTDVADGTLLPNAGFRVYDENKNVIVEGYTNEQGVATFELGYGKYYYQEFDAPEGYLIDETLFLFEIKADGEIVKAEMTNKKIEVSIDENDKTNEEDDPNNDIVNNESNNNGENITNNTENNENSNVNTLPQTGGINSIIYAILGLIISLAGVKLFSCKYEK